MKSMISRFIKPILGIFVIVFAVSCEDGNEIFDQIQAEVKRGAVLRTVELISNELPIGDASARFAVTIEEQDQEGGDLLQQVDVFIGFRDNVVPMGGTDKDFTPTLFTTVPASEFSAGPFGLPRYTFEASLAEMLAHTGVTEADLFGGDQFEIRFEVVLTDGSRYTNTDNSGTITGSFFSSPFLYTPTVICPVPDDFFTGTYDIIQQSGSAPFGIGDGFSQNGVVVSANGTNRQIPFQYDPGGFDVAYTFSIDLVCGEFQMISGSINAGGLGCGDGSIGQTGVAPVVMYDPNGSDAEFTVTIEDFNPDGGCGGTYEAVLLFRKQ